MAGKIQTLPQVQNLVVARYRDGKMIRGITHDFGPRKKVFHVNPTGEKGYRVGKKSFRIFFSELKAVFFVKNLEGRGNLPSLEGYLEQKSKLPNSLKEKVTFFDGEILEGTTYGYTPDREGFFMVPQERDCNHLRVFVISSAVRKIETWK